MYKGEPMQTIIIIPARYQSTRYPGKPLVKLSGKEAILWTLDVGNSVKNADQVYVATDDHRIQECVENGGGKVILTSNKCRNGTERVAEAALQLGARDDDIIINLQGDAPLSPGWFIEDIINDIHKNQLADMITPVLRCDKESYNRFVEDRKNGRVGATTVVFNQNMKALYFSKEIIPYISKLEENKPIPIFHHIGIYGYRMSALKQYTAWPMGPLEKLEQLEQLRFLEAGKNVFVTEVNSHGVQFWELNNPEDVDIIEAMINSNAPLKPGLKASETKSR
jgi:3-deoxy-manno-octulosonate cytidylyltransferase (CMP-KDO synthetase)